MGDSKEFKIQLEHLKQQNEMLNKAQALSGLGIWQYDIPSDKVSWTDEVYSIYELDPKKDTPTIQDVFNFSSPEEKEKIERIINSAIKNSESYDVDCSIVTKNGNRKYVNAKGRPYFEDGQLVFLFGIIKDITDRKEDEQRLRFSDFTTESISDGIYWIDNDAKFFRVNNGAREQLGYTKEELQGLSGKDINPGFTKAKSQEYWQKTREQGVYRFETEHCKKNGVMFPVEITNNIFEFDGKEFRVSIVRDITERKQKEKQILDALEEVKRLKDQLKEENIYLQEEIKLQYNFDRIITSSNKYRKILKQVEQVASSDATVLITGESGTGKELLARAIHNLSKRSDRPMVKINCATLPENLIESELFGHEKGAFTGAIAQKIGRFELANEATIFLDEIGELPFDLQAKLLRVLQEGEFERLGGSKVLKTNTRVVAATNRNLQEEVMNGRFREDLFYRLNVFPIESIPLRKRREDIPLLVQHFMKLHAQKSGKEITNISKNVMEALIQYNWPGNIRELENLIERAVIITTGNVLKSGSWLPQKNATGNTQIYTLEEIEKRHIKETLKMTNGKISGKNGAAALLGINSNTLYSRLKKYDLLPKKIVE